MKTIMQLYQNASKNYLQYIFVALTIILIALSYLILKPFFISLISGFILAYLTKPVYNLLEKKVGKTFSALICVLLILVVIIIPFVLIAGTLAQQVADSLNTHPELVGDLINKFQNLRIFEFTNSSKIISQVNEYSLSLIKSLITSTPKMILSIIITLLGVFYILQNWRFLADKIKSFIPLKEKEKISQDIAKATKNIIYGYTLIALIEFVIVAIGFYFAGVKFFLLLAALTALFAFIPGLGPIIIWLPTAIVYFILGNIPSAIGILITGLITSIAIDNILGPKLVGTKSNIHPLIMMVGVLGGIPLFGLFGVIIGPLILVYTIKILEEIIN